MPVRTPTRSTRRRRLAGAKRRSSASAKKRRKPDTVRRRERRFAVVIGGIVAALALLIGIASMNSAGNTALACLDAAGRPLEEGATIAGYGAEQLVNAKAIVDAGVAAGAPVEAQRIAVMTAMGESGLRVLDHGDVVGPDSRGLFQQRDNGGWGSYEDRMDPSISASSFYRVLLGLPDWQSLEPTIAAHRVQRNADERHYERFFAPATEVVAAITERSLTCAVG